MRDRFDSRRPADNEVGHMHDAGPVGSTPLEALDRGDHHGVHLHVWRRPARRALQVLVHVHGDPAPLLVWTRVLTVDDLDGLLAEHRP